MSDSLGSHTPREIESLGCANPGSNVLVDFFLLLSCPQETVTCENSPTGIPTHRDMRPLADWQGLLPQGDRLPEVSDPGEISQSLNNLAIY